MTNAPCASRAGPVLTLLEEDACSAVFHDTLFHCESLRVVSTGDLENVAIVIFSKNSAVDFLAHSLLKEGTPKEVLG